MFSASRRPRARGGRWRFAWAATLSATDSAGATASDTASLVVDNADPGVLAAGVCSADHIYLATGIRTVTVSATDDDGGDASHTITLNDGPIIRGVVPVINDSVRATATRVSGAGFWLAFDHGFKPFRLDWSITR